MPIKDDILSLKNLQEVQFQDKGRYVQCLSTPANIPVKNSINSITIMNKPKDETTAVVFVPTAKDYQFRVDVYARLHQGIETAGFVVTAKRDLGDGLIETIASAEFE